MSRFKRSNFADFLLRKGFNVANTLKLCRFHEIQFIEFHCCTRFSAVRIVDADNRSLPFKRSPGENGSIRFVFLRPSYYVRIEFLFPQISKEYLFNTEFNFWLQHGYNFPFLRVKGQEFSTALSFTGFSHAQCFINGRFTPENYTGVDEFDTQLCFDFVLFKELATAQQHSADFCPACLQQRAPADYLFKYNR